MHPRAPRPTWRALVESHTEADRGEMLPALGRAEALTHSPAAAEHLRRAYEILDDGQRRAAAAQLLGRTLRFIGAPGLPIVCGMPILPAAALAADHALALISVALRRHPWPG